jgi:hypothetical protein
VIGRPSRGAAAIAVLACALIAGGCGSSSSSTTETSEEPPSTFFGMMTQQGPTGADYHRMQQGKIGVYRAFFPWSSLAPSSGKFDFEGIDTLVFFTAAAHIEVQPYLLSTPDWVAKIDGDSCGDQCAIYAPRSEEALSAWREFVAAAIKRYGPGGEFWAENPKVPETPIRTWQIWNEQNSPAQYLPKPDVASYERMLSVAYEEIHSIDPDAEVVIGGMFGTPLGGEAPAITAPVYLNELYKIEGDDLKFDAVAVHPYGAQTEKVIAQVQALHDVVADNGDDAPLLVTEIGWSSGTDPAEPLERGLKGQAESLTEAYDYLIDHRSELDLQVIDWYSLSDLNGTEICAWCARSGLFTEDGEPKPAWSALTSFTGGS